MNYNCNKNYWDELALIINENAKLKEQLSEMKEALKPFAETGQEMIDFLNSIEGRCYNLPNGDNTAVPDLPKLTYAAFKKAAKAMEDEK